MDTVFTASLAKPVSGMPAWISRTPPSAQKRHQSPHVEDGTPKKQVKMVAEPDAVASPPPSLSPGGASGSLLSMLTAGSPSFSTPKKDGQEGAPSRVGDVAATGSNDRRASPLTSRGGRRGRGRGARRALRTGSRTRGDGTDEEADGKPHAPSTVGNGVEDEANGKPHAPSTSTADEVKGEGGSSTPPREMAPPHATNTTGDGRVEGKADGSAHPRVRAASHVPSAVHDAPGDAVVVTTTPASSDGEGTEADAFSPSYDGKPHAPSTGDEVKDDDAAKNEAMFQALFSPWLDQPPRAPCDRDVVVDVDGPPGPPVRQLAHPEPSSQPATPTEAMDQSGIIVPHRQPSLPDPTSSPMPSKFYEQVLEKAWQLQARVGEKEWTHDELYAYHNTRILAGEVGHTWFCLQTRGKGKYQACVRVAVGVKSMRQVGSVMLHPLTEDGDYSMATYLKVFCLAGLVEGVEGLGHEVTESSTYHAWLTDQVQQLKVAWRQL